MNKQTSIRIGVYVGMILLLLYLTSYVGSSVTGSYSGIDPKLVRAIASPIGVGFVVGLIVVKSISRALVLSYLSVFISWNILSNLGLTNIQPLTLAILSLFEDPISSYVMVNPLTYSLFGALGGFLGSLFQRWYTTNVASAKTRVK